MKTLVDIDRTLQAFEKKFGLTVRGAEQQSEAWFNMKLGVISASCAKDAVSGLKTDTRANYLADLVAQVCTGVIEEVNSKHMDWGKQNESAARSSYEFATGSKFTPLTFVFKDEGFRVGCSPDGVIAGEKPAEIKCPWDSAHYIRFLTAAKVKPDWVWQNQFTLWVLDADEIDMTFYDPRMKVKPLHTVTVTKDADCQAQLADAVPKLIEDMDEMLRFIGVRFGDQWLRIAQKQKESA